MSDLREALDFYTPNKPAIWPSETVEDYDERYMLWLWAHDRVEAAARRLAETQELVNEQAEDEGLWFVARTAPEAYLQQELRRLHAVVEGVEAEK